MSTDPRIERLKAKKAELDKRAAADREDGQLLSQATAIIKKALGLLFNIAIKYLESRAKGK